MGDLKMKKIIDCINSARLSFTEALALCDDVDELTHYILSAEDDLRYAYDISVEEAESIAMIYADHLDDESFIKEMREFGFEDLTNSIKSIVTMYTDYSLLIARLAFVKGKSHSK